MSCGIGVFTIGGIFNDACKTHDDCWESATCSTQDKRTCDLQFKNNMYSICDLKHNGEILNTSCKQVADTFHTLAQSKTGQKHFEKLNCRNLW